MRHGRKSQSKRLIGYKQHIGTHLDAKLVLACTVTPANRSEEEATPALKEDLRRLGLEPDAVFIDRAYVNSELTDEVKQAGGEVVCKPWPGRGARLGLYGKKDFAVDVKAGTITCPAGQVEAFEPGQVVQFAPEACGTCALRAQCTHAASGRGRRVRLGKDEGLQKRLQRLQGTRLGRAKLRERVPVEHQLADISQRQGARARYRGTRKNTFDLRMLCALQNLETVHRRIDEQRRIAA